MAATDTTVYNARVPIVTAGTAVKLRSSAKEVDWVVISAPLMNKGAIFLGDSNVTGAGSTPGTADGYMLMPGENVRLGSLDLAEIFIEGKTADCVYWIASSGYQLPTGS